MRGGTELDRSHPDLQWETVGPGAREQGQFTNIPKRKEGTRKVNDAASCPLTNTSAGYFSHVLKRRFQRLRGQSGRKRSHLPVLHNDHHQFDPHSDSSLGGAVSFRVSAHTYCLPGVSTVLSLLNSLFHLTHRGAIPTHITAGETKTKRIQVWPRASKTGARPLGLVPVIFTKPVMLITFSASTRLQLNPQPGVSQKLSAATTHPSLVGGPALPGLLLPS